jgi:acetyl/propionyl-CoA carboxylase alpha subunit
MEFWTKNRIYEKAKRLREGGKRFYFLEVNARVQVEHPVTEMVTGIDIIKEQIRIASGMPLSIRQDQVKFNGHAIECRITAESAEQDFKPSVGTIKKWKVPEAEYIRIDTHCYEGYSVPPYYDSLLAKLIVWGKDRQQAIERVKRALDQFEVEGIDTVIPFLRFVVNTKDFREGRLNTKWLENIIPLYKEKREFLQRKKPRTPACFHRMQKIGHDLTHSFFKQTKRNQEQIKEVEKEIEQRAEQVKKAGLPVEVLHKRGEWSVYERLEYLVDPGTWCPLHTLFNPMPKPVIDYKK